MEEGKIIRCVGADYGRIWRGSVAVEGERKNEENAGEILKMDAGSGRKDARIYDT